MKDLDFDELDRAVASVLDTSTSGETSTPEPVTPVSLDASGAEASPSISAHAVHSRIASSTAPSTRSALVHQSVESTAPATAPTGDDIAATPASPVQAVRRRIPHREGRFMDVVASSKTTPRRPAAIPQPAAAAPPESPVPAVSHEPQPATNSSLEAAINELLVSEGHAPVETTPEPSVTETPLPESLAPVVPAVGDAPSESESITQEPAARPNDDLETIAAELAGASSDEPVASSPFLPDAKVDKRPLGTPIEASDEVDKLPDTVAEQPAATVESAPEPTILEPETVNTPVPEELQDDLMAIESGTAPTSTTDEPLETRETQPVETVAPVSTGPTSIARQYKEQPRTASEDDESGAIFDPQTYQQPIEHPAKKSSGWGWVIAIVVIILLTVVAAVVAYFGGVLPVAL